MTDRFLETIAKSFLLTEKPCSGFGNMKVSGMKFHVRHFAAEGLGHVSVMTASGFLGLMKMDTLIITPLEKDMPLLSYDRVLAMGNDTLLIDLYDTLLGPLDLTPLDRVKESAEHLPEHDPGAHWYDSIRLPQSFAKKGKQAQSAAFDLVVTDYLAKYLAMSENAPVCDAALKQEKAGVYVEGLLSHGGPSTDVFKNGIGEEKTAEFFRTVLFATRA